MTAGALEFSFVSSFLSIASITCAVICLLGGILGFVYFFFPGFIINGLNTVNAKRARLRKHTIHAAGFTWNYYSGGKHNGQLVLLVHGFSASKEGLTILARYLAPHYRVVIPDLPGHGDTVPSDPKGDYTIRTQVNRLHQFMDAYMDGHQLPRSTKFHIAGISMGGLISGFFATKHPDRLLSTTLMCPAGISGERKSKLITNYESGEGNALLPISMEGAKKMMEMVFHKPPRIPENLLKYTFAIREKRHEVYTKVMEDILSEPLLLQHSLHDIKTPTLIIWGENDSIIDISCVDVLKGGLKCYYKVAVLEEAGHSITLEAPDRCGHHILEFLNNPHKWIVEHTQNAQETITALETSDTEGTDQQSADEEDSKGGADSQHKVLRKRRSKRAE